MTSEIGSLLLRAFAPTEDAQNDRLAQRILDATVIEATINGLRGLSIDEVARRAETTRMTVYRRFGRREQLIEAMGVREMRRFIATLRMTIESYPTLEEQGQEAFIVGLRFMHAHSFVRRAIASEPEAIVQLLEADNGAVFKMGCEFIAEGLRAADAGHAQPDQIAETLVRVFVSFLLLPRSIVALDDEMAARRYVRACITPLIAKPGGQRTLRRRS